VESSNRRDITVHPTLRPRVCIAVPYCFTFTHDAQPKGIKEVVFNMVTCAQEVVDTLNRLQKDVTMVTGEYIARETFRFIDIKRNLKAYLDDIAKALQMCHHFSSNWEDVSTAQVREDLIRLLPQLVDLCQRCHRLSYKLIGTHELYMNAYAKLVLGLTTLLRSSTSIQDKSSRCKVEEVMDRFAIANRELHSASDNMAAFFDGQLSLCRRHLDAANYSDSKVSFDEAKRFALQWMGDATHIQRAKVEVQLLIERVDDPVSSNPAPKDSTRCIIF
jgi:hypothetical protein